MFGPRFSRPTVRTRIAAAAALTALVAVALVLPAAPVQAAGLTVACGNVTGVGGLVAEIDVGNGGGGGPITVNLAAGCTYVIPEAAWDYDKFGNKIFTDSGFWALNDTSGRHNVLTVEGNGATIVRGESAGRIRFFDIGFLGEVVLKNLTLTGGLAPHGRPDGYVHSATAGESGGAIRNAGNLTLDNVTLSNNLAGNGENGDNGGSGSGYPAAAGGDGGAVSNTGTLSVSASTFSKNFAGAGGAGGDGAVNGGQGGTGGRGGAIYNAGTLTMTTSTVTGNGTGYAGGGGSGFFGAPDAYRGSGGGVGGSGNVTVTRSLFTANDAQGTQAAEGGAIDVALAGSLTVENSTFVANKAWRGGALHLSGGTATIRSSTFTGNDATGTGDNITGDVAALDRGATMTFASTLMYANDPTQVDCNTAVVGAPVSYTSLGGLMSDENNGCGTNTVVADPKLEALGQWGGPTASRLPQADSPALGAGTYCPAVDQRGATRPTTGCDVGAVERVAIANPGAVTGPTAVNQNSTSAYATTAAAAGAALEYTWSVAGVAATIAGGTTATPQITFTGSGLATVNLSVRVVGSSAAEAVTVSGLAVKVAPAGNTAPAVAWSGTPSTAANEGDTQRFTYTAVDAQGDTWALSPGFPSCGTGGTLVTSVPSAGGGYFDCVFPNGPTTPAVKVQVEDKWAAAASVSSTVTVAEVAPTITVSGSTVPNEGSVSTYAFSIQEPGSDTFVPVTSCVDGGASKVAGSDTYTGTGHSTSGTFQCRFGNGPTTSRAVVTANGGTGSVSAAIQNVAPSIAISGTAPAAENGATTGTYRYEFNAVDPGDKATLALVAGSASCGGQGVGTVVSADSTAVVCRFLAGPSSALVSATVIDPDGATSTGGGLTVQITNVTPTVTVGQPTGPVVEGSTAYFALTVTDPGLDTLTLTPPPGCTASLVNTSTAGRLTATLACLYADGPATVSRTVQVSDGTSTGTAVIADQQVTDVDPRIGAGFTGWDTWAGSITTLGVGGITDPGTDTATSIIVRWGDGTSSTYAWPLASSSLTHSYLAEGEFFASIDVVDEDGTHTGSANGQRIVVHASAPGLHLIAPATANEGETTTVRFTLDQPTVRPYTIGIVECGRDAKNVPIAVTNIVQGASGGSFDCTWPEGTSTQGLRLLISDSGGAVSVTGSIAVSNLPVVMTWTSGPSIALESSTTVYKFAFHASDLSTMILMTTSINGGLALMYGCGDGGTLVSQYWSTYYQTFLTGVVFDPATGDGYIECTFSKGPTTANVQVTIGDYRSETVAVRKVTVVNAPPSVTLSAPTATVVEGRPAVFTYETSDPSGEQVDPVLASCGPQGLVSSQSNGTFTCIFDDGPADYSVSITVTDGDDATTGTTLVHVVDAPPTSISLGGADFFDLGTPYTLTIGDTVDSGDDHATGWTVRWGDGSATVLATRTPTLTHVYTDGDPHTISVDVTDDDGSYPALGSKSVQQFDHVAPVLTIPGDTTLEGNATEGASWFWPRSAVDARDGDLQVQCTGYGFYGINFFDIGTTHLDCWATDAAGNRSEGSFTVIARDTTAPTFAAVNLGRLNATSSAGLVVGFNSTATDAVDWRVAGVCDSPSGQLFAIGVHAVHCTATDHAGNVGVLDFAFEVGDFTSPTITVPVAEIDLAATGPTGAAATFATPTAWDDLDGALPVTCDPVSGSVFALGSTTVDCSATDAAGNSSRATIVVRVTDTVSPVVTPPANQLVEPTAPSGARVTYADATAVDVVDTDVAATCSPASGTEFSIGTTPVICSATDDSGNLGTATFTVTVQDKAAPVITTPANLTVEATSPAGARVTYRQSAFDVVDGPVASSCAPASGTVFVLGVSTVTCSATDSEGNTGSATFTVSTVDTTAPAVSAPAHLTVEATGTTTTAAYSGQSATDAVDGTDAVVCLPASGFSFGFGDTLVTCTAIDARGNSGTASFTVSVVDTTAPVVTAANVNVGATSPDGAIVDFVATSADALDGAPAPVCSPASGTLFAPESTTTVSCVATDHAGNAGTGTLTVTVEGGVLTGDAAAGDTEVQVSLDTYQPGDYVVIDDGQPDREVRYIDRLGSIIFAAPLAHNHAAGARVSIIAPPQGDTDGPTITAASLGSIVVGTAVTATVDCADTGVGVEQCIVPDVSTTTLGAQSVTIRAWDLNGNLSTLALDYTVVAPAATTSALAATGGDAVSKGGRLAMLLLLLGGLAFVVAHRRRIHSGR